jgi:hypothetical protein
MYKAVNFSRLLIRSKSKFKWINYLYFINFARPVKVMKKIIKDN